MRVFLLSFLGAAVAGFAQTERLPYPIVDTGQQQLFDEQGPIAWPVEGAPFFGQDAQYRGNSPTYRDNGDGTVSDLVTGLMWTRDPEPRRMTLDEAEAGAKACRAGGYDDWRLPTIKELYSLIDFRGTDPRPQGTETDTLTPFIDTRYFGFRYGDPADGERIIDAQFVSSTRYVSTTMHGDPTVFGVNFADGRIKGYPIRSPRGEGRFFVRYVRGNPAYGKNRFHDNGDGTVTDAATGLMWARADSGRGMNWREALDYAERLELAGYDDWRLPNAKELQSIVNYTRSPDTTGTAALDPVFEATAIRNEAGKRDFGYYWTSTTHMREGGKGTEAVYISFGRALGYMRNRRSGAVELLDVHGAGAQRSDPKAGDPARYPRGRGPQGDVVRIHNLVRVVRGGGVALAGEGESGTAVGHRSSSGAQAAVGPAAEVAPPAVKAASAGEAEAGRQPARPNIVFILADDLGWTGTSVEMVPGDAETRSDLYQTPHLEQLAREGMRFSAAYAPASLCTPSRAGILTGKTPAELHMTSPGSGRGDGRRKLQPPVQVREFPEEVTTVAEVLRDAGYMTAHFGKWHLGRRSPELHGFAASDGPTENEPVGAAGPDDPKAVFGVTDRAIAFMRESVAAGRPFFVQLSHYAVHEPAAARGASLERFADVPVGRRHRDRTVAAMTWDLDASVGMIREALAELGVEAQTYLVFFSDNGAPAGPRVGALNNAPLSGGKGTLLEGGLRVPLFVAGPDVAAGAATAVPVTGCDLLPTFCEWAGVPVPDGVAGVSLAPLLRGDSQSLARPGDLLLFHYPHYGKGPRAKPATAIIVGSNKLIRDWETGTCQLFDLAVDPGEQRDLAAREPALLEALKQRMDLELARVGAQLPTANPDWRPARSEGRGRAVSPRR